MHRQSTPAYDAVVVGAGPNGLAGAITLARAGQRVLLVEAASSVGGGCRSAELTLPGFRHDVCAAVHPFAAASPFFRELPLAEHGLRWIDPPLPMAHPLDDGTAVTLDRSLSRTAAGLGVDTTAYERLMAPFVAGWDRLAPRMLGPVLRRPLTPLLQARFGLVGLRSAVALARASFRGERARALLAGLSAHGGVRLTTPFSASFGLVLALAGHGAGWPIAAGGSGAIAEALTSYLRSLGGEIVTGERVSSLDELPPHRAVLLDLTPKQLLSVVGERLPAGYRRQLERFRYGMATFKVDYALDAPVPWRAEAAREAGTLHLGGTLAEIAAWEDAVASGGHPQRPYVIAAQPSVFDPTRAPAGQHTFWAYCHVPRGSTVDMTARIETQIERFAPGFSAHVLARHVLGPADLERYNENYVGGDVSGGAHDGLQLFFRPALRLNPYATPLSGVYVCSSSTPPGAGTHGLCGYYAARSALRGMLRRG